MVTRNARHGHDLELLLAQQGASVLRVPLIHIIPPADERALQHAVAAAHLYDWIAFTSINAVEAFSRRRRAPLGARVNIAAVGPATAKSVAEVLGATPQLVPPAFSAEALAAALGEQAAAGCRICLFQAQDGSPLPAQRLRAAGLRVDAVAAYATVQAAPRDLIERVREVDVITLASGSAARALAEGLGAPRVHEALRGKLVACIGPVTQSEARSRGIHVELCAQRATAEGLVDALCAYYGSA